jgi:hypothetical protein
MLGQNLDNTIDKRIYYASRLMSSVKNNYIIIEKETLAMIYVIKNNFGIIYFTTILCFMLIIKHYCIWSIN